MTVYLFGSEYQAVGGQRGASVKIRQQYRHRGVLPATHVSPQPA